MKDTRKRYPAEKEAKELICEIGRRIYEKNMVAANDGNITVKIGEDQILATPTGVSKGFMTPEMISRLDFDGNIIESGSIKPSSEIKMHLRVFNDNRCVGACVHAHPINATAYAITGEWLDAPIFAESAVQLGVVPVAEFATPGTQEVPDSVAPFVKNFNCCLLSFHGALTWGDDLMQAYYRMEALEHFAHLYTITQHIMKNKRYMTEQQMDTAIRIREVGCGVLSGGVPNNRG